MRIALTGASSTGKSTTAEALMGRPEFAKLVPTLAAGNALALLKKLGVDTFDSLSRSDAVVFRFAYFWEKMSRERQLSAFLTDRSFVDVAAYWLETDAIGEDVEIANLLVEPCRRFAARYDLHFYFPFGAIPFVRTAQRSDRVELQQRVDQRIRSLLEAWSLPYVTVGALELQARVDLVLQSAMRAARESGQLRV